MGSLEPVEIELPEGISKEVVKAADACESLRPSKGAECTVHYVGRLKSTGEEFDSSEERGQPVTFTLGAGEVLKCWDIAVATMKRGEEAIFTVAPEYAYGSEGQPPKIPENAALVFEVTLSNWKAGTDLFGDGGVIRRTLEAGFGLKIPKKDDTVLLEWKISRADGEVLDTQEMMEYTVGSDELGPLSRAVNKVLLDIRTGEKVELRCSGEYAWGDGTYVAEFRLRDVVQINDISFGKDKSIMKKTVVEGKGNAKPGDADVVRLMVEGVFSGAGTPAPGFAGRKELRFTVGNGEVCDALECAIVEMLPAERCVITCSRPELCAEPQLGLEGIKSLQGDVTILLALVKLDSPSEKIPPDEKVKFATSRKEVGGKLFKQGRWGLALGRYQGVIDIITGCEDVSQEGTDLNRACESNKAMCMLKLGDNRGAKAACSKVLEGESGNVKALFRRASAQLALNEFVEAVTDLRHVLELDPTNTEAERLLQQALHKAKEEKKESSAMFTKMTKALDGDFAEKQAERLQAERETKKPGQVMSVAETERAMERAFADARAELAGIAKAKEDAKLAAVSDAQKVDS